MSNLTIKDNLLIHGENEQVMKSLIDDHDMAGKIDLVYIDPPFAVGRDFYISKDGHSSSVGTSGRSAYSDLFTRDSYLEFLKDRLVLLRELLSDQGSIYVHSDCKIGHYVKVLMDEIFGSRFFRNEITRIKCNPKNFKRIGYGNVKDMILFYSKSDSPIWNEPYEPYSEDDLLVLFPKIDSSGRRYTTVPLHAPGENATERRFNGMLPPKGRHWRVAVESLEDLDCAGRIEWSSSGNPRKIIYPEDKEGKRVQDIWRYKDLKSSEYPTQKNLEMLHRIIKTSSHKESIVLDCFCGSGTTLVASSALERKFIGIDSSPDAIEVCRGRLSDFPFVFFNFYDEILYNNAARQP